LPARGPLADSGKAGSSWSVMGRAYLCALSEYTLSVRRTGASEIRASNLDFRLHQ
jgi:hypothetical protein